MTLQDTLPLSSSEEDYVRITTTYRGRTLSVSGAMPRWIATGRLERLKRANPGTPYEVVDTTPPPAITSTPSRRRRYTRC